MSYTVTDPRTRVTYEILKEPYTDNEVVVDLYGNTITGSKARDILHDFHIVGTCQSICQGFPASDRCNSICEIVRRRLEQ